MRAFQHSACNDVLGAPPGVPIEDCGALPILRGFEKQASGVVMPIVQSFWRPSPQELAALNQGHPVLLHIIGVTHPPLSIRVAAQKQ